ncbi:CDP-glycerol glycerophosphotransferase family protein [Aeromonas caviae]|uniref:CDP-glycerol glycerophosphotransferase family protein n=1 Tax=Aeromonas caviae TaxID=648 RepID=UPI0038D19DB5
MNLLWLVMQAVLSLFSVVLPLKKNRIIFNSTGNNNYNFNSRFLFEYMVGRDKGEREVLFVINDKEKRGELIKSGVTGVINANSIAGIFLCLTAKVWVCSTIESPVFSLIRKKNRIVYHLGHGIPLKNIGLAENNISFLRRVNRYIRLRLFTHVTCYSELFMPVLSNAFKNKLAVYLELGQPRNDLLVKSVNPHSDILPVPTGGGVNKILYSPTWRPYAETQFFPFADMCVKTLHDFLEKTNSIIYLRPHPYYSAIIDETLYASPRVIYLGCDVVTDITPNLDCFNILVTDYSSIFLDFYAFDNKAVIFVPYDLDKYEGLVGFSVPYEMLTKGEHVYSLSGFLKSIEMAMDNSGDNYDNIRRLLNIKSDGNCLEHFLEIERLRVL